MSLKIKILLIAITLCFCKEKLSAQDIHFTQFTQIPLQQTPAAAGNFDGDYRFAAIYRNQWASVTVPYNTVNTSFDMKIIKSKKFNSFLASGLNIHFDQAGDARFQTLYAQIPIAYQVQLKLNENSLNLSAGLGLGIFRKSFQPQFLQFNSQFTGENFDQTLNNNENFENLNLTKLDISMGYLADFITKKQVKLGLGFGVHHLNRIEENFNNSLSVRLNQRYSIPVYIQFPIGNLWDLRFDYLFQEQGQKSEHLMGAMATYYLEKNLPMQKSISFGSYHRWQDALSVLFRYNVNNFSLGFAYDFNVSRLNNATNTYGATELSLVYIIKKVENISVKNKRKCLVF